MWGKISQVYPPKILLSSILLKLHQIAVLVDLFKFCEGGAPSITGCQDAGHELSTIHLDGLLSNVHNF